MTYYSRSPWNILDFDVDPGVFMTEFAIASISTIARSNKDLTVPGNDPTLGSRVDFGGDWGRVLGPLLAIVAAHLLLLLLILDAELYQRRLPTHSATATGEDEDSAEELQKPNAPYDLVQRSSAQDARYDDVSEVDEGDVSDTGRYIDRR